MAFSQVEASARLRSREHGISGSLSLMHTPHQMPKPVKDAKTDAKTSGFHLNLHNFLTLLLCSIEHWLISSRSLFLFSCLRGKQ